MLNNLNKYMYMPQKRSPYSSFTMYWLQKTHMLASTWLKHVQCVWFGLYWCKRTVTGRVWAVQVHVRQKDEIFSYTSTCRRDRIHLLTLHNSLRMLLKTQSFNCLLSLQLWTSSSRHSGQAVENCRSCDHALEDAVVKLLISHSCEHALPDTVI